MVRLRTIDAEGARVTVESANMHSGESEFSFKREKSVVVLTFDRPAQGNALTRAATAPLTQAFRELALDRTVGVVLIRGSGDNFCSGGDVKGFAELTRQPTEDRRAGFRDRMDALKDLVEAFVEIPVPIVAACQGAVAGAGLSYALGADLVIADDTVRFMFAHQRMGLSPDGGVSTLLPRAVGERKAIELLVTGAVIGADEALRIGLVSRIVERDVLQDQAMTAARKLAASPRDALRRTKQLVRQASATTLAMQLEAERDAIVACVGEDDFCEGVTAFLERRRPLYPSARDGE